MYAQATFNRSNWILVLMAYQLFLSESSYISTSLFLTFYWIYLMMILVFEESIALSSSYWINFIKLED